MLEDKLIKLIISFYFPVILGSILQQIYSFVDTAFVGRYISVEGLSAIGLTGSLNFLALGLSMGSAIGFCIPISQSYGANEKIISLNTYITFFIFLLLLE